MEKIQQVVVVVVVEKNHLRDHHGHVEPGFIIVILEERLTIVYDHMMIGKNDLYSMIFFYCSF